MSTVLATGSMTEKITQRINPDVARGIKLRPGRGLIIESLEDAFEVSKVLAIAGCAVPKHLRDNPGLCLNVCLMAYALDMDPFALANKTYVVNDRLCFEAALYHAVVLQRAPIKGRIRSSYDGEGAKRTCRVWAQIEGDEIVDYVSPQTGNIKPKNSPLWINDPDQQLFYFSVRSFARRHFPDVMMGIYTVDEMQDSSELLTDIQSRPSVQLLAGRLANPTIAATVEPTIAPSERDARELEPVADREPVKTEPEPTRKPDHREPGDEPEVKAAPTFDSFQQRIMNAVNPTAIKRVLAEAAQSVPDYIDQQQLDQLSVLGQEVGGKL